MKIETPLLIIGAGPFGLAVAAQARHLGIDYLIIGKSMDFWQANMPAGMFLRSACDWHLDPDNRDTIESFLRTQGLTPTEVEPLSLDFYLRYVRWFQDQQEIKAIPALVQKLDRLSDDKFLATLEDGRTIFARQVVVAPGCRYFKNQPQDLLVKLPPGSFSHTCDLVDFTTLTGKRCLIIGGRQSAFEWAALLCEAGAAAVHLTYRHESPAFAAADWSWVNPMVDAMVDDPGWFRNLPAAQKAEVNRRLWAEGRLKVEPWLESRVMKKPVVLWPGTEVASCEKTSGHLEVTLSSGDRLTVDHIILATGYKVAIAEVPFLAHGNLLANLATQNGYPVLDTNFQTNIPGLFLTGMCAVQDFGPFFAFTVSVRTSARLVGPALLRTLNSPAAVDG